MQKKDYLERIKVASQAIDEVGQSNLEDNLAISIPTCPQWTIADLINHQGTVFRFAGETVSQGLADRPADISQDPKPPEDGEGLLAWFNERAEFIVDVLDKADMEQPAWNWTDLADDKKAQFWLRRMVHEVAIHAYDAKIALNQEFVISEEWGIDGTDEYLVTLFSRFLKSQPDLERPTGSLHLHAINGDTSGTEMGEWFCELENEKLKITREHIKADGALKGSGTDLMLAMWKRIELDNPKLEVHGDKEVVKKWIAFAA